jgi:predicted aspartyl protease
VSRSPIPGEAQMDGGRARKIVLVRNVTLGTLTTEQHLDALIDTGATHCIVPPSIARVLGFRSSNRIRTQTTNIVGSQVEMDVHRLEYLKVGSAKAWSVMIAVYNAVPRTRYMLVGLSFVGKFRTTFDFDEERVLFRSRR